MTGPKKITVWAGLLMLGMLISAKVGAQNQAEKESGQDGSVHGGSALNMTVQGTGVPTLHVYADLIQVPVLVMGPGWSPIPRIASDRFRVSIGGGPPYRVQHVRLEGEDPISLGILLDLRGSQDELLKKMGPALGQLVPGYLHAHDRVSVYGLDCGLMRSLDDAPATPQNLQHGVAVLLDARGARKKERPKQACPAGQHFWDALGAVVVDTSHLPGRRVMLVVSNGYDKGSKVRANSVREYAQVKGVAIFGLVDASISMPWWKMFEGPFDDACQLSGGMVATANSMNLAGQLQGFVTKVRGRYILEFPRPYNATAGGYDLDVKIDHSDAWIRTAGISFPIQASEARDDSTTIKEDPSLTPVQGPHRILGNKH